MFDIHTHIVSGRGDVIEIISTLPYDTPPETIPFSVGIHPWFTGETPAESALSAVSEAAKLKNCVAIGECGLDRPNFIRSGRDTQNGKKIQSESEVQIGTIKLKGEKIQEELFRQQIEIANSADIPVIIHCVRAFPELLAVFKEKKPSTPWIIHGFRGSPEEALQLTRKGIFLSFGKSVFSTHSGNRKTAESITMIPVEMLLLETDNVESYETDISEIYQSTAEILGIKMEKLMSIIAKNAKKAFPRFYRTEGLPYDKIQTCGFRKIRD